MQTGEEGGWGGGSVGSVLTVQARGPEYDSQNSGQKLKTVCNCHIRAGDTETAGSLLTSQSGDW